MSRSFVSITTTTSLLMILIINIIVTQTTPGVDAQLYTDCQVSTDTTTGTTLEGCVVNKASPLTYTATDGTVITLGAVSLVGVSCDTSVPGTVDTCVCVILVDPSDPLLDTDFCNSCTVSAISETVFENYFDCSNRLTGNCVGLTADGACISSTGTTDPPVTAPVSEPTPVTVSAPTIVTTPAPVDPSTTSAPISVPVDTPAPVLAPVESPAPVGDEAPTYECPGKGKGKGKRESDDDSGKGKMSKKNKKKGKKCKKEPKEPKVPKVGKGKGGKR